MNTSLEPAAKTTAPIKIAPFSEDLRARLQTYKDDNGLTNNDLSREIGCGPTQISKYLNGKPDWNVERTEQIIEDILRNAARRSKRDGQWIVETPITQVISGVFETIRETNDMGMIFAPAGIGKTSGCELYCLQNAAAIMITVTQWRNNHNDVLDMLFQEIPNKAWSGFTKRGDFLEKQLKGSNRLIIIDNAHKLTTSGRGYVFDLHDATGCPIALVGNPELLTYIRKNDQHFSRIGLRQELKLKKGQAKEIATMIANKLAPEFGHDTHALLETIAEEQGHFRAVRKQITLAKKLRTMADMPTDESLKIAHTKLVRDYQL